MPMPIMTGCIKEQNACHGHAHRPVFANPVCEFCDSTNNSRDTVKGGFVCSGYIAASRWTLRRLVRLAAFVTLFAFAIDTAIAEASEISVVLSNAMRNPDSIQSYEFSVVETRTEGSSKRTAKKSMFYQSGDMFRTESPPVNFDGKGVISAYNGARFQQFYAKESILSFSSRSRHVNPYFQINPLLVPYTWLLGPHRFNWSNLKSPELWNEKATQARYVGRETVRSMECEVISLPYTAAGPDTSVKVYFAIALGYFPIRLMAAGATEAKRFQVDVLEHLVVKTDGADVVVPTVLRSAECRSRKDLTVQWRITPDSIKINHQLPEELFTISPSLAKVVDDYDHNMKHLLDDGLLSAREDPNRSSLQAQNGTNWVLVINVGVAILLVLVIAGRRYLRW